MAHIQNIADPEQIAAWVERKNPGQFTANAGQAAMPRPLNQRSRVIRHQFGLNREEFDQMGETELWSYLHVMLNRMVEDIQEMTDRLGRLVQYHSFPIPANTMNRAVNVYQVDGIFIMWQAVFNGIPRSETTVQQVVDFEFTAEIALSGDEKGSPRE